ncbi:DUF1302 family protein [Methylobacterium sp. Leaf123]|uniref:DUF1302 domain-containing protein n=1 Tax=Methylobacterium sp. Leaf123 TaxID=1736264 RepID=UPI00138F2AA9|nr:DUF1302 family protein [Methylobacterium sp. Leaf123]
MPEKSFGQAFLKVDPAPEQAAVLPGRPAPGTPPPPPTFALDGFALTSTLSVGGLFRTSPFDPSLVAISNGGTATSANSDDGTRNFDPGLALAGFRGRSALTWAHGPWEAKLDGVYYANYVNSNGTTFISPQVHRELGWGGYLNDGWVGVKVGTPDLPISIRLGNQFLRWNVTSFALGAQIINPQIASRIFLAGAGLEDSLRAMPMLSVSMKRPGDWGFEAFYKFDFAPTELSPCGFFTAVNDYQCSGGRVLNLTGLMPDRGQSLVTPLTPFGSAVARSADRVEGRLRNFGINVQTPEFGGPAKASFNFIAANYTDVIGNIGVTSGTLGDLRGQTASNFFGGSRFFRQFNGDIGLLGMSFRSNVSQTTRVRMEYNAHLGQPLQFDDQLTIRGASLTAAVGATCGVNVGSAACQGSLARANANAFVRNMGGISATNFAQFFGRDLEISKPYDLSQFGVGVDQVLPPILGASAWFAGAEFGGLYVHGYDPSSTSIPLDPAFTSPRAGVANGIATPFSYGYRLLSRIVYKDVVGLPSIAPSFGLQHDVKGFAPYPYGLFSQGLVRLRASVDIALTERMIANITGVFSVTDNYRADVLSDRDFVLASLSYKF